MKYMKKTLLQVWIPLALGITLLSGVIYVVGQQILRQSANDPQIQIAEDTALALSQGKAIVAVLSQERVDIAVSLAPYIIIFDRNGHTVGSSGLLDGKIPVIPSGLFAYVRNAGEDRITWQPEPGIRSAIVVTPFHGVQSGFVLAGRSLREVEIREDNLLKLVFIGWVCTLVSTLLLGVVSGKKSTK